MPYTFGALTNDTMNFVSTTANIFFPNSSNLVCMWFYPTSLTAGRYLWNFVDTNLAGGNGVSIDTTTTRLRFQITNTTTHTLTGVDNITTDRWWFLAVFVLRDQANARDILRAWLGNETQPPLEMTITTSATAAPVTATALSVGNGGNGSLAFIGDIGSTTFLSQRFSGYSAGATAGGIFPLDSISAISQSEADYIYERWVQYFWLGQPRFNYLMSLSKSTTNNADHIRSYYAPMNGPVYYRYFSDSNTSTIPTPFTTITGATLSTNREPSVINYNWLNNDKFRRRM